MHSLVLSKCVWNKCDEDIKFCSMLFGYLRISPFWKIGVDTEDRILSELRDWLKSKHTIRRLFKTFIEVKGSDAFKRMPLGELPPSVNIYIETARRIPMAPRFLFACDPSSFTSQYIHEISVMDIDEVEYWLKLEEEVFTEWTKRSPMTTSNSLSISITSAEISMDTFSNISNSNIINKSRVADSFNKIESTLSEAQKAGLLAVTNFVGESGVRAAGPLFDAFREELCRANRDKSLLTDYWTALVSFLPGITALSEAVNAVRSIWE